MDQIEGRRSAGELVQSYETLGIPHFQRGLVWDARATALLLESLYHRTPCGSVILWRPTAVEQHGVALGAGPTELLIVDGQQRIRSLHGVFGGGENDREAIELDEQAEDDQAVNDADEADDTIWCLNLGRLPEFSDAFPGGRRYQLFRRVSDPRLRTDAHDLTGALRQDLEALLPLSWYLDTNRDELAASMARGEHPAVALAAQAVLGEPGVDARLRGMRTAPLFYVSVLGADHSPRSVIATYNRINTAGKRVESEERAFANLVAASDEAEPALQEFFAKTWGGSPTGAQAVPAEALTRDGLLQRQKENHFGFRLYMRTVVMALAYHSGRAVGSGTMSFDAVDQDALSEAAPHLPEILRSSVPVLVDLKEVLRNELFCDDLRMLPETSSLWPVIQLLIRFPTLAGAEPKVVAALVLRVMLANLEKRQLLLLCNEVAKAHHADDALEVFNHAPLDSASLRLATANGVEDALALTDRYVLLWYWRLRCKAAKDFSYDSNLAPAKAHALRLRYKCEGEPLLSEHVTTQKQHLVPYEMLKRHYGLTGSRPGRHQAHHLGNLTFISEGLNSISGGVGSTPLNLEAEPTVNLVAHLLDDAELRAVYGSLCKSDGECLTGQPAREAFERFCAIRGRLIAADLVQWEADMRAGVGERTNTAHRSAPRLVDPGPEDLICAAAYPESVADALVSLLRVGFRCRPVAAKGTALSMAYRRDGGMLARIDLLSGGAGLRLKLMAEMLGGGLDARLTPFERRRNSRAAHFLIPTVTASDVVTAVGALEVLRKALDSEGQ